MEKAVAVVQQRPRRQPRFLDDILKTGHAVVEGSMRGTRRAITRKSGDWRAKIKLEARFQPTNRAAR
jgi:hypothetical protein